MSAPTYVIREGHVRGQGRYLQACKVGPVWGEPQLAARFFSLGTVSLDLDPKCARIVRVVVKPKDSIREGKAYGAGYRLGRLDGRLAALEEAEQACSLVAEAKRQNFGTASSSMDAARDCVDAIAALRGVK